MTKSWRRNTILELALLAMVLWVAHYFYFRSLGLYEDDYTHTSPPLAWQLPDLVRSLSVLVTWPLGRPLGFFLGNCLAFLGGTLGGLSVIYIIGFVVQITNVYLFYFLLRRIGHGPIAGIGALTFGLFPADTTHIFLMHALGLHTSLTLLLIACHCYLSGRKTLAHVFSVISLLTYESPYVLFLAVPLLCQPWDKKLVREMIRQIAVWLGILLAVVAIRTAMGEGRIEAVGSSSAHLVGILGQILRALVIGPAVSLSTFWVGPQWTLSHWNHDLTLAFVGSLPILVWMLSRVTLGAHAGEASSSLPLRIRPFGRTNPLEVAIPHAEAIKLPVTAVIMLSLAYGFSFTHYPPIATYGRGTSVHLAAAFGGALLFAWICSLVLRFAQARHLGIAAIGLLALYLSWLVAYRFSIQQDFRKAWQNEQRFWNGVVAQVPDMTDGTIIFVLNQALPGTHFIQTNSWTDPLILQQIFRFPSDWKTPPRLFVVGTDWTQSVVLEGDQLEWQVPAATWKAHWEVLPDSNVVLLRMVYGKLVRRTGVVTIQGRDLHLKPLPANAEAGWAKGTLYPLLISASQ